MVVTVGVQGMLLASNEYDAKCSTTYRTAPTTKTYSPNVQSPRLTNAGLEEQYVRCYNRKPVIFYES